MKEELGLEGRLDLIAKFLSPKVKFGGRTEWEFLTVFETVVANPHIILSEESEGGKFVSLTEFKRMLAEEPEKFTPDTVLAAQRYHRLI